MDVRDREEIRALTARLGDMVGRAEKGDLAVSQFLTPRERLRAQRYLNEKGASHAFFGGYDSAERQRVYLLPDYVALADGAEASLEELLSEYGFSTDISAIRIRGSGYERFGHRDILGALLGLGLERSVIGDILLTDGEGREAIAFCDSAIARYIIGELTYVSRDKVRVELVDTNEVSIPQRKTQAVNDTVAAPRLDAVVAALCNLSREKARAAVVSGLVEIDFESEERPDRTVSEGAVLSVRGFGRYRVLSLSDKTRKGRYRLSAEKYV